MDIESNLKAVESLSSCETENGCNVSTVKSVYDLDGNSEEIVPSLQNLRKLRADNKEGEALLTSVLNNPTETLIGNTNESHHMPNIEVECDTQKCINIDLDQKHETEASKNCLDVPVSASLPVQVKISRKVAYIYSHELIQQCDNMHKIPERASMVHSLIEAYGLLKCLRVIAPSKATEESIRLFHSSDYVDFLKKINDEDDEEIYDKEAAQFGLSYDCPAHKGIYDYTLSVGGATITAAEGLVSGQYDVVINWCGGWHHAQKDCASGYCYVNDIVLGILTLRQKFCRILYVDLDVHHGDGVENAFYATSSVMTVSIHKYAAGFFPGSGRIEDIGVGKGEKYTVNIPLQDGIRDKEFVALFCRVIQKVKAVYQPEAIVCQCGADGLAGDPMDSFNLTSLALGRCVYFMLDWALPTILLGGGGYHHTNTARCWALLTGVAVGKKLPPDIPDHQFFMEYGPDYEINVTAGNRKDQNSHEYLRKVHQTIMDHVGPPLIKEWQSLLKLLRGEGANMISLSC